MQQLRLPVLIAGVVMALGAGAAAFARRVPPAPATTALVARVKTPEISARAALGRDAFFDAQLSTPPGTSCASCHDPARAFSGNHGSTNGVAAGSRPGHFAQRNTPSVLYLKLTPAFHWALEDDDDVAPSPFGGFGWSGRASSIADFARFPLFDADEMNNANDVELAAKLAEAPYAEALLREYPDAKRDAVSLVAALADALQAYLTSDAMAPFTSKYDDYVRGTIALDPIELRGLAAFKSPDKGACNACHTLIDSSSKPERSLFTNYGYDALAAPRNRAAPANEDPRHYDLGLCARNPADAQSSDPSWCVKFRTPSLRNVAVRERFMHNGVMTSLRDAVAFYATRSTSPRTWYPPGTFDDVPAEHRRNVNVASLPYNRREGAKPALDEEDIDAIVAFLGTLTDAAYRTTQGTH